MKLLQESPLPAQKAARTGWNTNPIIYEINTWVWLTQLSSEFDRPITLASVPAQALGEDRQRPAATLICTLPGATLLHQGQIEGRRIKLPVQINRGADERWLLFDALSDSFTRYSGDALLECGLQLELPPFGAHIFRFEPDAG